MRPIGRWCYTTLCRSETQVKPLAMVWRCAKRRKREATDESFDETRSSSSRDAPSHGCRQSFRRCRFIELMHQCM